MAVKKDYYKTLEVSKNATDKEIRSAYRRLSKIYHPDKNNGSKEAEEKFKDIAEAYHVLSDKTLRERYDRYGTIDEQYTNINPHDIWASFFNGTGFGSSFGGFGSNMGQRVYQGRDKTLKINVTLNEIYTNAKKTVTYSVKRPCSHCNGSGSEDGKVNTCPHCNGTGQIRQRRQMGMMYTESISTCPHCNGVGTVITKPCKHCGGVGLIDTQETIELNVPTIEKVLQQTFVRRGEGHSCQNGLGQNGDLNIMFNVAPEDGFDIDKNNAIDIITNVEIPVVDCILGCDIPIKHIDGKTYNIKIEPCTVNGKVYKLKGLGFKVGGYTGNLLVKVIQIMPTKLSNEDKELLNKLKQSKNFQK